MPRQDIRDDLHQEGTKHRRANLHTKRLLLLDDDAETLKLLALVLSGPSLDVLPAQSGAEALTIAQRRKVDLLLVDLWLPDMTGLELIRKLQDESAPVPFIMITGRASVSTVVEAMKLGALHVFEKPLVLETLREAVTAALWPAREATRPERPQSWTSDEAQERQIWAERQPRSAVERWALFVLRAVYAESDPRTLDAWARAIGVSRSVLCETSRIVHVSPRTARDFARLLRAVCRSVEEWRPETVIDFADARTLKRLEAGAGLDRIGELHNLSVDEFLRCQKLIPQDHPALTAIRRLLDVTP